MPNVDFGEAESYFRSEPMEDWKEARAAQEMDLTWEPWGNGESGGQLPVFCGFAIGRIPTSWAILVPHWMLVLLVGGIGTIPWLRFQFSLRTLLIATTLVAVVLGLVVWMSRAG
jgi:hypothetical protein